VKWSVGQWRGLNRSVPWKVFMVCGVKWSEVKWGEVQWSEEKVLLKIVCYTCGLTTLETRYCSFSPLCCFSYMHFVLICTVVVLYCFVICVCVCVRACVCMCVFSNVCVCEGFVMCGCFWSFVYCTLTEVFLNLTGFSYPDWGFSVSFPQL